MSANWMHDVCHAAKALRWLLSPTTPLSACHVDMHSYTFKHILLDHHSSEAIHIRGSSKMT
jgi:hypothetical protein